MGRIEGNTKEELAQAYLEWYRVNVSRNVRLVRVDGEYVIEERHKIHIQHTAQLGGEDGAYYTITPPSGETHVVTDWRDRPRKRPKKKNDSPVVPMAGAR
jgi:hypothetical protein